MKKITYCIIFLFFISNNVFAQSNSIQDFPTKKKWLMSDFNFGIAVNWNKFQSMSLNELMVFAKDPHQMQRDLSGMTEEATPFTAGLALHGSFSFSPLSYKNETYRKDRALQIGIALHSEKEAMVSYKNEALDTSIVFCNIQSELSVEAAYLMKGTWGKQNRWHWYLGGGMNTGFTFDNEMMLISGEYFEPGEHPSTQVRSETIPEKYEANNVFYSRVFIPYGLHYQIGNRFTLGFNLRKGIGMQVIGNEKVNFIRRSGSFALGAKIML